MQFSTVALIAATAGSAMSAAVYSNGTSTVTDIQTTVITITSCSENKCHEVPVTTGLTTVTENHTVYTTYCPLSTTTAPVAPSSKPVVVASTSTPVVVPTTTKPTTVAATSTTPAVVAPTTTTTPVVVPATTKPTTVAATSIPPHVSSANGAAGNAVPVVAAGLLAAFQLL